MLYIHNAAVVGKLFYLTAGIWKVEFSQNVSEK